MRLVGLFSFHKNGASMSRSNSHDSPDHDKSRGSFFCFDAVLDKDLNLQKIAGKSRKLIQDLFGIVLELGKGTRKITWLDCETA